MRLALWVVRDRITTARAIDDLLADAATRGIFDLVVQVGGRGDDDSSLDHLVRYGAAVGVRIHAHRDWLLRPDGASTLDRAGDADLEDIVARYRVEGINYDDVHHPPLTDAGGPDDRRHVTALVREVAARLRRAREHVVISANVFPDPDVAHDRVLQRWPEWAEMGLVDLLCPMAHRKDTREVGRLLALARRAAPRTPMWGGLMGYAGEPERLREQVRAARESGCEGAILFAYDPAQRDLLDAFAAP
ncbi:MAG TPA: hypothetical protein VFM06_06195 [Candidatus Limnocylindria bacterium]|nr:hypothetical protein [Candidatus Limnocylindria bacterium]